MLKYLIKKSRDVATSNPSNPPNVAPISVETQVPIETPIPNDIHEEGIYLQSDPAERKQILEYHPNQQDEVQRAYILKGPTRIWLEKYPSDYVSGVARSFAKSWYKFDWLEYSIKNDAVFCLPCYLFYDGSSQTAFVKDGYRSWHMKKNLKKHVGKSPTSHHNNYVKKCDDLMNHTQSIQSAYLKHTEKEKHDNVIRLKASLEEFYDKVVLFCGNLEINVHDMESRHVKDNRSKRKTPFVTTLKYFKYDCFYRIIYLTLAELNDRFTPENSELLHCLACLSPCSSFEAFDTKTLVRMSRLYPNDFLDVEDEELSAQLECYINCVQADVNFSSLKGLSDLCKTLVRTKKHKTFRFVYKLVKLALTLPVATATVERAFSGMKYVKNELRNKMANPWLNDCLVTFVEKEVFSTISARDIISRFQGMRARRMQIDLKLFE